jgi:DNA repair exonuclease SbcCD ATPase subunit
MSHGDLRPWNARGRGACQPWLGFLRGCRRPTAARWFDVAVSRYWAAGLNVGSTVSAVSIELDGELWEPVPGATVSAEEFVAARSLIQEIHRSLWWNPWWMTDRRADYDAAWETCGQWTRTDPAPDPPHKSVEEYEAELEQKLAEAEAQPAAKEEQAEQDRAERAARYDAGRAQARLALLEEQGILADKVRERDEIISRDLFPLIDDRQRDRHLAALEPAIAAGQRAVDELAAVVGDPETVCDERGWLPAERRELSLRAFKDRRAAEIRQLRTRIPARQAELKTLTRRSERATLREALRRDAARLASLEAMAPMKAGDMCSECVNPACTRRASPTTSPT